MSELLANPQVEAVIIATPARFHTNVVVESRTSRQDCLLKKTIALTLEDADPAIAAAKAAEVPLQVAFNAAGIRHLPRRVRPLMPAI